MVSYRSLLTAAQTHPDWTAHFLTPLYTVQLSLFSLALHTNGSPISPHILVNSNLAGTHIWHNPEVWPGSREELMTEDGIERFVSQSGRTGSQWWWWCGIETPANIGNKHDDDFHSHRFVWYFTSVEIAGFIIISIIISIRFPQKTQSGCLDLNIQKYVS